ncbi:MAG: MarR family winged helix-turn-helix transcriptional regulator [Candidatus Saccharimonas sp.]
MAAGEKEVQLTVQQQRILKLLFKFRFVSALLLGQVMGISRVSVYGVLEKLVVKKLVTKIYNNEFRIDRKPAYYYLNKTGVTAVRKLMDARESAVHTLYKNDEATEEFIEHCLKLAYLYTAVLQHLPENTDIFTRTEINRFKQFPKNRPDLYIRTPDGNEAIIVLADEKPLYITRKMLEETITHSEDEGWDGDYPRICFVFKDGGAKNSFLYTTNKKLESMGMDEGEIYILATSLTAIKEAGRRCWASSFKPKEFMHLFE